MNLSVGDRVEIVTLTRFFDGAVLDWIGRRGKVIYIMTTVTPPHIAVDLDGDDHDIVTYFRPDELRKLSLLELIAEAASG